MTSSKRATLEHRRPANLLVALALNDPRAPAVDRRLRQWSSAGETLHAPELFRYEAANALTRAVVAG